MCRKKLHCLKMEKIWRRETDTTSSLSADFKVETRTIRHFPFSVLVRKNGNGNGNGNGFWVVYVSLSSV